MGVYLLSPLAMCVAALPAWAAAVQPLADTRAAARQRWAYGGPELTTLAASLWIWLPGYPSKRSDRCVGGVQSFLIKAILLSREHYYKLSPCVVSISVAGCEGRDRAVIGCAVSFTALLNDSRGFRRVLGGYPIVRWERTLALCAVEDIHHQEPQYNPHHACRLWLLCQPRKISLCNLDHVSMVHLKTL